jgi:cell division septation protein DedD
MLTMLTFRAGKFVALAISLICLGACSREQQDWRSAEASDTVEGYARFLKRHPDSELVTEARTRFAQLSEDREWQRAGEADTADAYKQFLAEHPNGKWAQEARIRIENFALGAEGTAATASNNAAGSAAGVSSGAAGLAVTASSYPAGSAAGVSSGAAGPAAATLPNGAAGFAGAAANGGASAGVPNGAGAPSAAVSNAAAGFAGAASSGVATGASAGSPAASGSAVVSPGEMARTPTSAPMVAGEAAQIPTSPSPATYGYPQPAAPAQTPSAIGTAWRSAASGATAYGVQLGAFASENAAASEWEQLTARFSAQLRGLVPHVVSAETTTGRLFRLQALVPDEATARTLCDMLKKQSQACVPVLPH